MNKLLYIGKSNKNFTHDRIYSIYFRMNDSDIIVYTNNKVLKRFKIDSFFDKKFKFINEQEYNQLIRKQKLKKIDNEKQ